MTAPTDWMARAACVGHPNPDMFFPDGRGPHATEQAARAAEFCKTNCTVMVECHMHRVETNSEFGVWGAVNFNHKNRLGVTVIDPRPRHGTEAMYKRHLRDGETPCDACKEGATAARARRKDDRPTHRRPA